MMEYKIENKPTTYNGTRFRSRLEARWAAFFDLLKWDWTYEPLDLGGWSPDFLIRGAKDMVYVEVKPITDIDENVMMKMSVNVWPYCRDDSQKRLELLLLGVGLFREDGNLCLGWIGEPLDGEHYPVVSLAQFRESDGVIGYCSDSMSFHDRITGEYDGNSGGEGQAAALWAKASNQVQWQAI